MNKRERIVKEAIDLFSSKGYEKTTITDIIRNSDVSRGGFYHHFQSKNEILDDIADIYLEDFSSIFNRVKPGENCNHAELILAVFKSIVDFKIRQIPEWSILQKLFAFKGNHEIIMKIAHSFEQFVTKVITQVIESGNTAGEFDVKYPEPLAGLMTREFMILLRAVQKVHQGSGNKLSNRLTDHIGFFCTFISRELGLEQIEAQLENAFETYLMKMNKESSHDYSI